jgi:hypothetical protein
MLDSLSDQTKVLIIVVIFAIIIYFVTQSNKNDPIHNEGSLTQTTPIDLDNGETDLPIDEEDEQPSECDQKLIAKFKTRNSSRDGSYAFSSYSHGKRGGKGELDKFFEGNHPLDDQNEVGCGNLDETHARYIPGKRKKLRDVDKFDADAMLPREENKDWFDNPYEPTTVKNAHLINIYRPIGANTIGSSLKNASRDIRGDIQVQRVNTGPWNMSSITQDDNIRSARALCQ